MSVLTHPAFSHLCNHFPQGFILHRRKRLHSEARARGLSSKSADPWVGFETVLSDACSKHALTECVELYSSNALAPLHEYCCTLEPADYQFSSLLFIFETEARPQMHVTLYVLYICPSSRQNHRNHYHHFTRQNVYMPQSASFSQERPNSKISLETSTDVEEMLFFHPDTGVQCRRFDFMGALILLSVTAPVNSLGLGLELVPRRCTVAAHCS